MSITPVNLTDTFDVWRTRTNQIIALTDSINSNTTNALSVAQLSYAQANTANVRAVAAFGQANTANATAIAAFTQANTANIRAVAAFTQANSVGGAVTTANNIAIAAFGRGNTAQTIAVAAFTQANNSFPSGTKMIFVQSSAPTGWTKDTTHNNKALRVVSGSASFGGTVAFTTAFSSQSVGATTLSVDQIPSHSHTYSGVVDGGTGRLASEGDERVLSTSTGTTGGGQSHTHTLNVDVQYVDVIIATKD